MSKFAQIRSKVIHLFISHLQSISLLLYLAGLLSLLFLPSLFDRNIYFSENALSVGSFQYGEALKKKISHYENPTMILAADHQRQKGGNEFIQDEVAELYRGLSHKWDESELEGLKEQEQQSSVMAGNDYSSSRRSGVASSTKSTTTANPIAPQYSQVLSYVQSYLTQNGINQHHVHAHQLKGHAIENFYSAVRAPKASGKESILLLVPLRCDLQRVNTNSDAALSSLRCNNKQRLWNVALGMALMKHFSTVKWLNKDVLFIITDHYNYEWDALSNILKRGVPAHNFTSIPLTDQSPFYSEDVFLSQQQFSTGRIRETLVLDFKDFQFEYISLLTEGINGELPNLDMLNVVNYFANRENLETSFSKLHSQVLSDQFLQQQWVQRVVDKLAERQRDPNSRRHFFSKVHSHVMKYVTLWRHWWNQLTTLPTGLHAPFRRRVIHSITLTNGQDTHGQVDADKRRLSSKQLREENLLAVARVVEGTVRSMNNLLEELHQSFFLYVMDSTSTFLGFEDFSPTMWLMVLSLTLLRPIGAFYARLHRASSIVRSLCLTVFVCLTCGVSAFLSPYLLQQVGTLLGIPGLISFSFSSIVRVWTATLLGGFAACLMHFNSVDTWCQKLFDESDFELSTLRRTQDNKESSANDEADSAQQVKETARMFAFLYAGIGMLALVPLDPALAITLGVYIGVLHFATAGVSSMRNGLMGGLLKTVRSTILLLVNPYTVMFVVSLSSGAQQRLSSSGFLDNVYEHLIFSAYCLVAVPTWSLLFMISSIRNKRVTNR
mmetsp:Transcript_8696/g.32091  ORF Transcript_8696/g.32091 Transcript_8696/m.32091 type:complete len:779 (-) Transcript_8696:2019-4355(-)